MSDLLDPSALLQVLQQQLLPPTTPSSSPLLRNPADALAAIIHTIMTRLDFRLTGLAEDDRLPPPSGADESIASTNKLPTEWNAKGPDHYCFRYKHHQSSLDYLVKIVKLGNKAVIHGVALQGTKTSTMEVVLSDYLSTAFWPYPHEAKDEEPLVNGYIGSSRLKDLTVAFKTQILQQLVPGLRKDGYVEEDSSAGGGGGGSSSSQPSGPSRPLGGATQPRPRPPDDPSLPSAYQPPFRNPLIIGDRDLDPLGGSPLALPPRFGGGGTGGGFGPPPLFPGGGGGGDHGGGMYVGPNHPMFRNRFPPQGIGLPQGAVPPGARFDPIYPGGSGPEPPHPDVGGARPQNFAGEPDWDELAPPRGENPFGGNRGGRGGRGGGGGSFPDTGGWYA